MNPPEPTSQEKRSSFSSTSAPCFRRNSFLSRSMIEHEKASVYESFSFFPDSQQQCIISLKECQGFVFNQNLFATPYQQLRTAAKEKRQRALSFSKPRSRSNGSKDAESAKVRRHTSHDLRPQFIWGRKGSESAVEDDPMDVDGEYTPDMAKRETHVLENDDIDEEEDEEDEEDEDTLGEYDDYEDMEYGLYGAVQVTDIVVEETDHDYIPSQDW